MHEEVFQGNEMNTNIPQFAVVKETWIKVSSEVIQQGDEESKLLFETYKLSINEAQKNYDNGTEPDVKIDYKVVEN